MARKAQKRDFIVEVHGERCSDDEIARLIITALFGKSPKEVAEDFIKKEKEKACLIGT